MSHLDCAKLHKYFRLATLVSQNYVHISDVKNHFNDMYILSTSY